jgi:hypothetical protein
MFRQPLGEGSAVVDAGQCVSGSLLATCRRASSNLMLNAVALNAQVASVFVRGPAHCYSRGLAFACRFENATATTVQMAASSDRAHELSYHAL